MVNSSGGPRTRLWRRPSVVLIHVRAGPDAQEVLCGLLDRTERLFETTLSEVHTHVQHDVHMP